MLYIYPFEGIVPVCQVVSAYGRINDVLENNSCFVCFMNPVSTRYIQRKDKWLKKVIYAVINMV
jgi:hypothetical protein